MNRILKNLSVVAMFCIIIPNVSEAVKRKLPTCMQVKEQASQPLHIFEYGETNQVPAYGYSLFLRDREYMQKNRTDTNTKKTLQQYIKENTKVIFTNNGTVQKKRKNGSSIILTKVKITASYKPYKKGKRVTRDCYINASIACPIIAINDSRDNAGKSFIASPGISCASPDGRGFMSQSLQDTLKKPSKKRITDIGSRCNDPACIKRSKARTTKTGSSKSFAPGAKAGNRRGRNRGNKSFSPEPPNGYRELYRQPQRPQSRQKTQSSPISGFLKQLQGVLKQNQQQKTQESARRQQEVQRKQLRERQEYLARLQLSQCNPAHPYYLYNKEKCTGGDTKNPVIESYGTNKARSSTRKSGGIDTVVVRRGTDANMNQLNTNKVTLAGINAQECKDKKAKALVVARPKVVESGQETTIKWASVCTASCKLTAKEVGVEDAEPILTELGIKGEVTGKLYNDTRFDLKCKDFKGNDGVQSGITVRLKK